MVNSTANSAISNAISNLVPRMDQLLLQLSSLVSDGESLSINSSKKCTRESNVSWKSQQQSSDNLSILSNVFCGICISSLFLTLVSILLTMQLFKRRFFSTFNYCLCLLLAKLVDLFNLLVTVNYCRLVSGFHLFLLISSFMWIHIQGYLIYEAVALEWRVSSVTISIIGYSMPSLIVSIFYFITGPNGLHDPCSSYTCRVDSSSNVHYIWSFVALAIVTFAFSASTLTVLLKPHWKCKLTETFYRNWLLIATFNCTILLLSAVERHTSHHMWSLIITLTSGCNGPVIFILEVLLNRQLLESLSQNTCSNSITTSTSQDISCNGDTVDATEQVLHASDLATSSESSEKSDLKSNCSSKFIYV